MAALGLDTLQSGVRVEGAIGATGTAVFFVSTVGDEVGVRTLTLDGVSGVDTERIRWAVNGQLSTGTLDVLGLVTAVDGSAG